MDIRKQKKQRKEKARKLHARMVAEYKHRVLLKIECGALENSIAESTSEIAEGEQAREEHEPKGTWWHPRRFLLALSYSHRAQAYAENEEPQAALADYGNAIELMEGILNRPRQIHFDTSRCMNKLADCYEDRGIIWDTQGFLHKATTDFYRAAEIRDAVFAEIQHSGQNDPSLYNMIANTFLVRGNALGHRKMYRSAINACDQGIKHYETLNNNIKHKDEWLPEWTETFAQLYYHRGMFYLQRKDNQNAVADLTHCIELGESLQKELDPLNEQSEKWWNDLITAYLHRGAALVDLEKSDEAIKDYDRAVLLGNEMRKVLKLLGRWCPQWRQRLVEAYDRRGVLLTRQGKSELAIKDFNNAIAYSMTLRRDLSSQGKWSHQFQDDLAGLYLRRGIAWKELNDYHRALDDFGTAIDMEEALREELVSLDCWDVPWKMRLFSTYVFRCMLYEMMGEWEKCKQDAKQTRIYHCGELVFNNYWNYAERESKPKIKFNASHLIKKCNMKLRKKTWYNNIRNYLGI